VKSPGNGVYSVPAISSGWFPNFGIHSNGFAIFSRQGVHSPFDPAGKMIGLERKNTT
jgi:hypothetical protein